ncbi:hypothetical protein E2562_023622 [Oryza meyeriana var. granulata]|nr:hypothetical protein E2562_023622 [Oryza meyeriana var. granulata]
MAPIGVEALKGLTMAVDTYFWLHKGALSCGDRIYKGLPIFLIHFAGCRDLKRQIREICFFPTSVSAVARCIGLAKGFF